ncbi:MAG: DUF1778 domain-containing protein [Thermomicrobiales bacterium]
MTTNVRNASPEQSARDDGLEARTDAGQNATVNRAAILLSRDDSLRFTHALIDPPEPNEQLHDALRAHRELIAD